MTGVECGTLMVRAIVVVVRVAVFNWDLATGGLPGIFTLIFWSTVVGAAKCWMGDDDDDDDDMVR